MPLPSVRSLIVKACERAVSSLPEPAETLEVSLERARELHASQLEKATNLGIGDDFEARALMDVRALADFAVRTYPPHLKAIGGLAAEARATRQWWSEVNPTTLISIALDTEILIGRLEAERTQRKDLQERLAHIQAAQEQASASLNPEGMHRALIAESGGTATVDEAETILRNRAERRSLEV